MDATRTIAAAEIEPWVRQIGTGFHFEIAPGFADYTLSTIDLARTWASFDADRVVGTLRSFPTAFTVPGPRQIRASALTNVTVAPTHRRQGRLTAMIEADLRASADRGETVGILIASEFPIYGRYGYGPAVDAARYSVLKREAAFRAPPVGTVQLSDRATLRADAPGIYDRFRSGQPGSIERPAHWWDRRLGQVEVPGDEPAKGQVAAYRSAAGELEGYVMYGAKQEWEGMRPQGVLTVQELVATSAAAYHALWSFCCGIDLLATIEAANRPVDEVLPHLMEDARAVSQSARFDFVWVRILDVRAALEGRTYATSGRLVIEVVDPLGIAGGRFSLDGGPDGARCEATKEGPDLTVAIDVLGSVLLGGTALRTFELAGRVDAHDSAAVSRFDAMFASSRAPWCNTWF